MRYRFFALLDNYNVTRDHASGEFERVAHPVTGTDTITLPGDGFSDHLNAIYLIDDGESVTPFYVAGWNREASHVFLNPFPTNPGGTVKRPDGRTVDYSAWLLGPRRAYHLKVSPMVVQDQGQDN